MSLLEESTQKKSSEQTCIIGEQGDLGLWNTPLSDNDQKVYNEQQFGPQGGAYIEKRRKASPVHLFAFTFSLTSAARQIQLQDCTGSGT